MRGWAVVRNGQPLEAVEVTTPEPTGTQVLLKTTFCGVCHSDLYFQDGYYDLGGGKRLSLQDRGVTLPFIPGHETVGKVVALGPQAKGVAIGDHRLVYPWAGCGKCKHCVSGNDQMCLTPRSLGVFRDGGYGTHCAGRQARASDRLRQRRSCAGSDLCVLRHYRLFGGTETFRCRAGQSRRHHRRGRIGARGHQHLRGARISEHRRGRRQRTKNSGPRARPARMRASIAKSAISPTNSPRPQASRSTAWSTSSRRPTPRKPASPCWREAEPMCRSASMAAISRCRCRPFRCARITIRGSYTGSQHELHELVDLAKPGNCGRCRSSG